MSIFNLMDKIDDNKSLNENWNIKNVEELNKLKESLDSKSLLRSAIKAIESLKEKIEEICEEYSSSHEDDDFDPAEWGEPDEDYSDDSDMLWEYQDKLKSLLLSNGVSSAIISAISDYGYTFDDKYNLNYEQLLADVTSLSEDDVEEFLEESIIQMQESIKNPNPRMFKKLCVSKDPLICEKACNILFDWYSAEGAFEDFTTIRDFIEFVESDVYNMLEAASYSDDIKIVCDALGLDYSLFSYNEDELDESVHLTEATKDQEVAKITGYLQSKGYSCVVDRDNIRVQLPSGKEYDVILEPDGTSNPSGVRSRFTPYRGDGVVRNGQLYDNNQRLIGRAGVSVIKSSNDKNYKIKNIDKVII